MVYYYTILHYAILVYNILAKWAWGARGMGRAEVHVTRGKGAISQGPRCRDGARGSTWSGPGSFDYGRLAACQLGCLAACLLGCLAAWLPHCLAA